MTSGQSGARAKTRISWVSAASLTVVLIVGLAGCSELPGMDKLVHSRAQIDPKLGVSPSPRVIADANAPIPKGGGYAKVGQPYVVGGKTYKPRVLDPGYKKVGLASWYGDAFHGRRTANGEVYDQHSITAAHPTMPLPSYARLTSLATGRSLIVRVNDRGPYHSTRMLDMSQRAASILGVKNAGVAKVQMEYIGPAPLDGDDTSYLLASYRGPTESVPTEVREKVMVASASGAKAGRPIASPLSVLPPERPYDIASLINSVDPATYSPAVSSRKTAVARTTLVPPVQAASFTTAAQPQLIFRTGPQGVPLSGFAPLPQTGSPAFDGMSGGVAVADMARRFDDVMPQAASDERHEILLGVFRDPENAMRLGVALAGYGHVVGETVDNGGARMQNLRLEVASGVSAEDALAAARAARVVGAKIVR